MERPPIAIPQQKRSQEKRQAIIVAGYDLFCTQGYHRTNTAQIAQHAGVSTGIVYRYFHDKHEILLEVIARYIRELEKSFLPILDELADSGTPSQAVERIMDRMATTHGSTSVTVDAVSDAAHREFMALALLDDEVQTLFDSFERRMIKTMDEALDLPFKQQATRQTRLRIAYHLVENAFHGCDIENGDAFEETKRVVGDMIAVCLGRQGTRSPYVCCNRQNSA